MNQICLMQNTIRNYAWGSRTALAELMGGSIPSHRPEAELWMGAHPSAPSRIYYQERWQALDLLIREYPRELLGRSAGSRFNHTLPFLFKVLAADQPLSVQAHPDRDQARKGFQRENQMAVPMEAPQRNYKDDQHKPECVCALTAFEGMCGFRSVAEMMTLLGPVWPAEYNSGLTLLTRDGIKAFFSYVMTLEAKPQKLLVERVVENSNRLEGHEKVATWIARLAEAFGTDIGVLSPILLNLITLSPGEAIFLPAGQLHAYLNGTAIELMANSDNVLRGGLTPKHVEVPELLNILDFSSSKPELLAGEEQNRAERIYPSPVEEFILSHIRISQGHPYSRGDSDDVPEVLLCTEGEAQASWQDGCRRLNITKGQSVFVPANVGTYTLEGHANFYRATVNL